jgi:hypothetical protein
MEFMIENKAVILGFLLALSELLSLSPKIKANGIFQLVSEGLKKVVKKDE